MTATSPAAPVTGHVIPGDVRTGSSAGTDFAGSLGSGSSHNFSGVFTSAPVCVASDTHSSPTAPEVSVTTTSVTVHGTTGHTYTYICVGRN